jgi:ATP-dependent Lon protease
VSITEERVVDMLGPPPYTDIADQSRPEIGVATGLAWTSAGGDILSIETTTMKGKGNLQLTGQLGEVMQESAHAAYTYLRAHAKELKIASEFWKNADMHIHVPEGAIPKDGPSAGVALTVSMLSALRKKAPTAKVAMTGEITLQGKVLGVGGLKEKMLAAHRAGMTTVLIPKENEKDLIDIPKEVSEHLAFIQVGTINEALAVVMPAAKRKRKSAPRKKS